VNNCLEANNRLEFYENLLLEWITVSKTSEIYHIYPSTVKMELSTYLNIVWYSMLKYEQCSFVVLPWASPRYTYVVSYCNINTSFSPSVPFISDIVLVSAAPVTWMRVYMYIMLNVWELPYLAYTQHLPWQWRILADVPRSTVLS
jgi:hypothetical protein